MFQIRKILNDIQEEENFERSHRIALKKSEDLDREEFGCGLVKMLYAMKRYFWQSAGIALLMVVFNKIWTVLIEWLTMVDISFILSYLGVA